MSAAPSNAQTEFGQLTDADYAKFEAAYVTREVLDSAGVFPVTSEQGKQLVGRHDSEDYSGLCFPYYWPGIQGVRAHRVRRNNPPIEHKRGIAKERDKYLSAPGWGNPIYFHPDTQANALSDVSVDLYITEGQKKCLALYRLFRDCEWTAQPLALNGVWGHRGKTGIRENAHGKRVQVKGPIPDLDRIEWSGRKVVIVFDTNTATDPMVAAARNELAIELTRRGAAVYFVDIEPESGVNGIDDYIGKHGGVVGVKLLESARPFDPSERIAKLPYTDAGNETAFEYLYGRDFLYDVTQHQWRIWDGFSTWPPDTLNQADRAMLDVAMKRKDAAAKESNEQLRKRAIASAFKLQNVHGRKAALESAQSNPIFARRAEDFDQHDLLFGCADGVLNLETEEFGPGRRSDMLTKKTRVEWNASATCAAWLKFLREVFPENPAEMTEFLRRAVGYSLTGMTREEVFFILHGRGRNGKGTFLRVLSEVLGDYAGNCEFSTLIVDRDGRAPRNDVAAMAGKRFITAQESREGARLDESLIKSLTGGDLITARFLHREFFTFKPTWKIWLATNHRPEIHGTDDGIWSRPRLIPFDVSFEGREDKTLKQRLTHPSELAGILAWAVSGCRDYLTDGSLAYPDTVTTATAQYRNDSDFVQRFIDECCRVAEGLSGRARALYQAFSKWATSAGEGCMTETAFGRRLVEKDFTKDHTMKGAVYAGIALQMTDAWGSENA